MSEAVVKPIRKTHQFYNTAGNLWDNTYLTSPKVAKFYHRVNQTFLSTQKASPHNQSMVVDIEKAKEHRAQSLLRQRIRKAEREAVTVTQLEAKTKGRSDSLSNSPQTGSLHKSNTSMQAQVPVNEWQRIDYLPRRKLAQFITAKCVRMDECEAATTEREQESRRRERQREALLSRHAELSKLEEKAGVIKLHSPDSSLSRLISTPFGLGRKHHASKRFRSLSRPKAQSVPRNPLDYRELQGLMVSQHPIALAKVKRSQSHIPVPAEVSMTKGQSKESVLPEDERKKAMEDIEQFTDMLQAQTKGFCGKDLEQALKAEKKSLQD